MNKSQCSEKTIGTIIKIENKGLNFPTLITVEYIVNSTTYHIKESLKLKNKAIKLWIIPIGQKKVPVIQGVSLGKTVSVNYNPIIPS